MREIQSSRRKTFRQSKTEEEGLLRQKNKTTERSNNNVATTYTSFNWLGYFKKVFPSNLIGRVISAVSVPATLWVLYRWWIRTDKLNDLFIYLRTFFASFSEKSRLTFANETSQKWLAYATILTGWRWIFTAGRISEDTGRRWVSGGHVTAWWASVDGHIMLFHFTFHQFFKNLAINDNSLNGPLQVFQLWYVTRQR